jgi:hypothetical protein
MVWICQTAAVAEEHDRNSRYHEGQVNALTIALEEHDRLFRAEQPA